MLVLIRYGAQIDEDVFVPNMFNEDVVRSLSNTCAYRHSGSGAFCGVQLNQAQCQAAATANCVNGATGKDSTLYVESGDVDGSVYDTIKALVDGENMNFWGPSGLERGCYVLKGKTGPNGGNIWFFKTSEDNGTLDKPTTNDKNICFKGKIFKTSITREDRRFLNLTYFSFRYTKSNSHSNSKSNCSSK